MVLSYIKVLPNYHHNTNTLADDLSYWKAYILPSGIADIPLNQLGRTKLKAWSCQTVTKYEMKKKYFANVKRTLTSLPDYAVDEEIIDVNRLRSIKLQSNRLCTASRNLHPVPYRHAKDLPSRKSQKVL